MGNICCKRQTAKKNQFQNKKS